MNKSSFSIYHPNARGTGCAVKFALTPANGDNEGYILASFANQKSVGDRTTGVFQTFDWDNKIEVKLGFADICQMLQVFRGELESIADGKGLYHRRVVEQADQKIVLRHLVEPVLGYSLEVYETNRETNDDHKSHIFLNPWEGLGISEAFAQQLGVICFGIPCGFDQRNGEDIADVMKKIADA